MVIKNIGRLILKILKIIGSAVISISESIYMDFKPKIICSFCEKESEVYLCDECKISKFERVEVKYNEIDDIINLGIDINLSILSGFKKHIYMSGRSTVIRKYITDIKYYDKVYLINSIIYYVKKDILKSYIKDYDVYIYTPNSFKSSIKRGVNISKYISISILKRIGYKKREINNILITPYKCVKNYEIKHLNKSMREEKVKNKYILKNNKNINFKKLENLLIKSLNNYIYKNGKIDKFYEFKILLVDDVYTTGSTLNYLSELITNYIVKKYENLGINKNNIKIDYFTLIRE